MLELFVNKLINFFHFKHSKQSLLVTILLFAIVFSLVKVLWASMPDPGHLWVALGDGTFIVSGPSIARTYTFPDASTTVLTTNSLISVAQGGTGTSSLSGVLLGNGTNAVTATTSPAGLLVGTTETQALTGKTINASDNTITCDGIQAGYLAYSNSSKFLCVARGTAGQVLRTNAAGTNIEYATVASGPSGADTQLQYNDSGSFGASSSLAWNQSSKSLGLTGSLVIATGSLPGVATTGTIKLFNQSVAGREMLSIRSDESGDYYAIQPSWYQNTIAMWATSNGSSFTSIGTLPAAVNLGGGSDAVDISEAGFFDLITTAATSGNYRGWGETDAKYYRGSMTGRNGYFFFARLATDATVSSVAFWAGLTDRGSAAALATDDPIGSRSGFAFSTALGESNWMFSNKNGATENRNSTGMAIAASKVYDLYFYNPPQGANVTWRIDNLTDGSSVEGGSSTSLPTSSVAMRSVIGVRTITNAARALKYQKVYVEVPR